MLFLSLFNRADGILVCGFYFNSKEGFVQWRHRYGKKIYMFVGSAHLRRQPE